MSKMVDECHSVIDSNTTNDKTNQTNHNFICGVVEGIN